MATMAVDFDTPAKIHDKEGIRGADVASPSRHLVTAFAGPEQGASQ